MDKNERLFLMQISDGYSFRNMLGAIKSETTEATMILTATQIRLSFINKTKTAVHRIELDPLEFTCYEYNIKDSNGEVLPEGRITFNTAEFFNTTKMVGKRDSIRIYWLRDDTQFNVQPIKVNTKDPGRAGASFVTVVVKTEQEDDYIIEINNGQVPNVRVQAKEFSDLCSQANTLKCPILEIVGRKNGVLFRGILSNNTPAFVSKFGNHTEPTSGINKDGSNVDEYLDNLKSSSAFSSNPIKQRLELNIVNTDDLMTSKLPNSTIKALSKFHNISPPLTNLRFFFAENKPTRIESPIGTYGKYSIALRNARTI